MPPAAGMNIHSLVTTRSQLSSPSPRPARASGNGDKSEAILLAALSLFVERGFHGTAVPEVAERAGVGAGTIYRYFASKEALVNVVFRQHKQALLGRLLADFPLHASTREQFSALWRRTAQYVADSRSGSPSSSCTTTPATSTLRASPSSSGPSSSASRSSRPRRSAATYGQWRPRSSLGSCSAPSSASSPSPLNAASRSTRPSGPSLSNASGRPSESELRRGGPAPAPRGGPHGRRLLAPKTRVPQTAE